ncbi:MAG: hypothetical protein ACQ9IQ_03620 [Nitrospirales bacterium]
MPRPKRWFHVSQDINFDPEFERLCRECGLSGVRFFLQVMAILDKTENHWSLQKDFNLNVLARSCGTKPKFILSSYRLLIDMNWISVGVDEELNQFIYAPNYLKYRGNKAHENDMTKQVSCSPPSLPFPFLKKEKGFEDFSQISKKTLREKEGKTRTIRPQAVYCKMHEEDQIKCMERCFPNTESERVKLLEKGWLCDEHQEVPWVK